MKVSGNEISVTVTKACVGAGVARGVAEDIGKACLKGTLDGHEALQDVLHALDGWTGSSVTPPDWSEDEKGWSCSELAVLQSGPALIDMVVLSGVGKSVCISRVENFELIKGLASASGFDIDVATDGSGGAELKLIDTERSRSNTGTIGGCEVDDALWKKVCAHASEILVPADDTNRADAGAGLTDND